MLICEYIYKCISILKDMELYTYLQHLEIYMYFIKYAKCLKNLGDITR